MKTSISIVALAAATGLAAAQPTGLFTINDTVDVSWNFTDGVETTNLFTGSTMNAPSPLAAAPSITTNHNGTGIIGTVAANRSSTLSGGGTNVYFVTVTFGTYVPPAGFFTPAITWGEPMYDWGTTLGSGAIATSFAIDMGVGGNGLDFSSVWGGNTTAIASIFDEKLDLYHFPVVGGDISTRVQSTVTGASAGVVDNGDLTVGMSYDWMPGGDVGNLGLAGGRFSFYVSVVPTPASAALLGLGSLVAVRRRRA